MATAILLGILQGTTEFLPISSSGHIALGSLLLRQREAPLSLVVLLHGGTLIATLLYFRRQLAELIVAINPFRRTHTQATNVAQRRMLVAIIAVRCHGSHRPKPSTPGTASRGHALDAGQRLHYFGLLLTAIRFARATRTLPRMPHALAIGVVQGLAVLPGISRSGSTISAGTLSGLSAQRAFEFSFLLSLPAVSGALFLDSERRLRSR